MKFLVDANLPRKFTGLILPIFRLRMIGAMPIPIRLFGTMPSKTTWSFLRAIPIISIGSFNPKQRPRLSILNCSNKAAKNLKLILPCIGSEFAS